MCYCLPNKCSLSCFFKGDCLASTGTEGWGQHLIIGGWECNTDVSDLLNGYHAFREGSQSDTGSNQCPRGWFKAQMNV